MGLPFIGEALHLLILSYSMDLHPFIKTRIQRYGPIFRTKIVGQPVVVSADPEINHFILQQEGNMVELWYLNTFSKILGLRDSESRIRSLGCIHENIRNTLLRHFGAESLKAKIASSDRTACQQNSKRVVNSSFC
ncbi:Cytochrome P [Parasponia andersonii]|uniref:Cytochrome P n=1 Tax=Parasponia andersonii TaxID=3476 RepID=A0A2P5DLH7_PARAD|nr:Cytochrome P [Parasponia andersonii]